MVELKPDEGRLLTDEEMGNALSGIPACGNNRKRNLLQHRHATDRIAEAQLAKADAKYRDKLAQLREQINQRRQDAFGEMAYGSKEKKLQKKAITDAFDIVLELINKEV